MGLMLSVLVFSVGVIEALSCYDRLRLGYLPLTAQYDNQHSHTSSEIISNLDEASLKLTCDTADDGDDSDTLCSTELDVSLSCQEDTIKSSKNNATEKNMKIIFNGLSETHLNTVNDEKPTIPQNVYKENKTCMNMDQELQNSKLDTFSLPLTVPSILETENVCGDVGIIKGSVNNVNKTMEDTINMAENVYIQRGNKLKRSISEPLFEGKVVKGRLQFYSNSMSVDEGLNTKSILAKHNKQTPKKKVRFNLETVQICFPKDYGTNENKSLTTDFIVQSRLPIALQQSGNINNIYTENNDGSITKEFTEIIGDTNLADNETSLAPMELEGKEESLNNTVDNNLVSPFEESPSLNVMPATQKINNSVDVEGKNFADNPSERRVGTNDISNAINGFYQVKLEKGAGCTKINYRIPDSVTNISDEKESQQYILQDSFIKETANYDKSSIVENDSKTLSTDNIAVNITCSEETVEATDKKNEFNNQAHNIGSYVVSTDIVEDKAKTEPISDLTAEKHLKGEGQVTTIPKHVDKQSNLVQSTNQYTVGEKISDVSNDGENKKYDYLRHVPGELDTAPHPLNICEKTIGNTGKDVIDLLNNKSFSRAGNEQNSEITSKNIKKDFSQNMQKEVEVDTKKAVTKLGLMHNKTSSRAVKRNRPRKRYQEESGTESEEDWNVEEVSDRVETESDGESAKAKPSTSREKSSQNLVDDKNTAQKAFWLIFSGEYTKAMSKDWHSSHFCCWQCDESLTGQRYVLRDDHPYCIKCYESVFANSCEECSRVIGIDSKDLSYKDKHWHEACFLCSKCRVSLVDKQFGSKADKIYCGNCYDAQFASRCDGCGQIFRAGTKKMEYKTRQWHEQCFCCCVCKTPIGTKSFIPREQEIYCATCYEEKFATRCVKCNKIITSGGVTYKNEPWHRECFTCTNCGTSLAGQRFTSREDKPYCADCFGELFAKRCTACCKPITGIGGTRFISFEDRHWHNDCFICAACKTSLVGRGFITDGEDIICPECAKQKLM